MSSVKLPKKLTGQTFSTKEAVRQGLSFYALRMMLESGEVQKITRGIYRATQADFSEDQVFAAASLRIGSPSAVCLVSALAAYKLTDAIPKRTWLMVDATKRTTSREIRLLRTRNPKWKIGIEKRDGYWITTLERTLVDAILYRRFVGTNLCMEALRKASKESPAVLGRVLDMGKKLGVSHRIRPYIEALA